MQLSKRLTLFANWTYCSHAFLEKSRTENQALHLNIGIWYEWMFVYLLKFPTGKN